MKHPEIFFGVCRHNSIIPLKLLAVKDYGDGSYRYTIGLNHPKPNRHMEVHHSADFETKYVSANEPLCDQFTRIRLTLDDARTLAKKSLQQDLDEALRKANRLEKQIKKIDEDSKELECIEHSE